MKFRLATPLDAERLAYIETQQPLSAHWGVKGFASETIQPAARVWCWEENGEILGFLAMRLTAGFGEILNLAVLPKACRQGIGFRLLAKALADAKEKDGHELTLEVNVRNAPAISLYLKAGLKELGRREKFYNNQDDALIMGITL